MSKQLVVLFVALFLTIIIQIVIIAFCLKEMRERQIIASDRIEFIQNYCLEE